MLTFALVTAATGGAGDAAQWAAVIATALLPFAFLAGSCAATSPGSTRTCAPRGSDRGAGDTERRRLERNLHDGAQARLVALAMLLGHTRGPRTANPLEVPALLDAALRSCGRACPSCASSPAASTPPCSPKGARAAVYALASSAPIPVTLDARGRAPARGGRGRRLLRGLRGARQRRQVRPGDGGEVTLRRPARASSSTSPTTASAAPTQRAAPAWAGSPTASRRSTARSHLTARPAAARGCTSSSPAALALRDPAPLLRRDVTQRLRERPAVAGEIFRLVLPLAVLVVGRLLEDARPVRAGVPAVASASSTRTITRWVSSPGRGGRRSPRTSATIIAPSPNAIWERWSSPISPLHEAEDGLEPLDGCAHVRVDQNRNHGGPGR